MKSLIIALIMTAILVVGCQAPSRIEVPGPGGGVIVIEGSAADDYVEGLVENAKTAKARVNEALVQIIPTFIFIFVGGLAFWGLTRSKWAWILPTVALCGIALTIAFMRYSGWISAGVILLALAVLIWKAVQYHRERDENAKNFEQSSRH